MIFDDAKILERDAKERAKEHCDWARRKGWSPYQIWQSVNKWAKDRRKYESWSATETMLAGVWLQMVWGEA